jgi:hypothetical protein
MSNTKPHSPAELIELGKQHCTPERERFIKEQRERKPADKAAQIKTCLSCGAKVSAGSEPACCGH